MLRKGSRRGPGTLILTVSGICADLCSSVQELGSEFHMGGLHRIAGGYQECASGVARLDIELLSVFRHGLVLEHVSGVVSRATG